MTADPPACAAPTGSAGPTVASRRPDQAAEQLAAMAMESQPGERLGTKDELRGTCGVSVGTFNEALRMVQPADS